MLIVIWKKRLLFLRDFWHKIPLGLKQYFQLDFKDKMKMINYLMKLIYKIFWKFIKN